MAINNLMKTSSPTAFASNFNKSVKIEDKLEFKNQVRSRRQLRTAQPIQLAWNLELDEPNKYQTPGAPNFSLAQKSSSPTVSAFQGPKLSRKVKPHLVPL
jgi:hypothetical protein